MLDTEFGIMMEVIPEQPEKAEPPIFVTELGMVSEVRSEQPLKAEAAIPVVPSFISIFVLEGIVPLYL